MNYGTYLWLKLKMSIKALPSMIIISFLFLAGIIGVASVVNTVTLSDESTNKLKLAIVGDIEGSYLDLGVKAVTAIDYSKYSLDFTFLSLEKAEKSLSEGKITGYVIVPDGFVEAMSVGDTSKKLIYVSHNSASGISVALTAEAINAFSDYVMVSQGAVYAFIRLAQEHNTPGIWETSDEFVIDEVKLITGRKKAFDITYIGVGAGLATAEYYICGFTILFFLFLGVIAAPIFKERSNSFERYINVYGAGAIKQIVADYISLLFTETAMLITDLLAVTIIEKVLGIDIVKSLNQSGVISFGFKMIPVLIIISAFQLLIFEIAGSGTGGVLAQFFVSIFGGFLSGCFYPIGFYPDIVQEIAHITPIGMSIEYMGGIVLNSQMLVKIILIFAYALVFVGASCLLRNTRLKMSH